MSTRELFRPFFTNNLLFQIWYKYSKQENLQIQYTLCVFVPSKHVHIHSIDSASCPAVWMMCASSAPTHTHF